jgi:hypothetical protein
VFLVGYTPVGGGRYVPAWTEIAVTLGFIAMIVLAYRFVVLNFPVIDALPAPAVAPTGVSGPPRQPATAGTRRPALARHAAGVLRARVGIARVAGGRFSSRRAHAKRAPAQEVPS